MVQARLHIICGNCGCSDMFSFHVEPEVEASEADGVEGVSVFIICNNCSTLHSLANNATYHKPE